ncbi:MAG: helix-hairpin-helix domain-containing protein, partial [Bacteroidales bacterium]
MTDKGSDLAEWGVRFFAIFMLLVILFRGDGKATEPPEQLHERLYMHIENLAEAEGDVTDHSGLIEILETLAMHPINLNTATADDLRRLFMLTEIQIGNLLRHRADHGSLISIHELQTVAGFDRQTIDNILPFITIDDRHTRRHFSLDNLVRDGEHVLFLRYQRLLDEQKGFSDIEPATLEVNPNARYLGSPYRLYTRYRYTWYQNVSFGITAEKDPGEEFFRSSQPQGFDFYSAHLHLRDLGRIKALSIGDYQVQFGQ